MNKTNMFYPYSLTWLLNVYVNLYFHTRYGKLLGCFIPFVILPFVILIPTWYILDVMGNIIDWICMMLFVELPMWGLTQTMIARGQK